MVAKLKAAIHWRIIYYRQQRLKFYWKLKQLFDFSKKEKVEAISVVVVGRNDNYGGDFTERLRTTLDWNLSILPNPELIYIEWNQVPDRPSDCDWIAAQYPNAKCYIVPKEIHDTITQNPKMPVMEYFGKNLGIRKATNNWVLIINSDILLDFKLGASIKKGLSKRFVYGTHYYNIIWDGKLITRKWIENKGIIKNHFTANNKLDSVVGNFILTHKKNWYNLTGYDETLNYVRAGVDTNGLKQFYYNGLKPMVLGNHYHLDHLESMINQSNETNKMYKLNNIPYKNSDDWGFFNYNDKKINSQIWQLEKI